MFCFQNTDGGFGNLGHRVPFLLRDRKNVKGFPVSRKYFYLKEVAMRRRRMSKRSSKRAFRNGANKVNSKNRMRSVSRGGIRL